MIRLFPVSALLFAGITGAGDMARLPFLPASAPDAGRLEAGLAHRFDGPMAPAGERNLFRHGLGADNPGSTGIALAYGLTGLLSAALDWETRGPWDDSAFQTAGAEMRLALLRESDGAPLSLTASLNAQARLGGSVEAGKKYSAGGLIALECSLFAGFSGSLAMAGQSHTNVEQIGKTADHTLATGIGLIHRGRYVAAFGEALFPLHAGSRGFRRTYGTRAPDGIPDLALGTTIFYGHGALDVACANTPSLLAANFLAGAGTPTPIRLMEWRLGLAYRQAFDFSRK